MPKRKASTAVVDSMPSGSTPPVPPQAKRRAGSRKMPELKAENTNPDENPDIIDGDEARRASPDATDRGERFLVLADSAASRIKKERDNVDVDSEDVPDLINGDDSESSLSELPGDEPGSPGKIPKTVARKPQAKGKSQAPRKAMPGEITTAFAAGEAPTKAKSEAFLDPEVEENLEVGEEEIQAALSRPPPVNSDYLPLPWTGRLGYACLNTYLRYSNPPVFASRTCRIASILENRHPLKDPSQPPHPTKNRPDKDQPADVSRGQRYVESLGLANARDCVKMLEWNERYNIKFMRLSSEMFPFASHEEYGYKLAPFAAETLAEVGKVAAKYNHRLTTHPGQFTQLGSPREVVITNALRDLEYHEEMLSLLKLPEQQDRDAVMILHLGGVFGDKEATMQRFRETYSKLSDRIKRRLVLENDDVCYSVHELLPLCEELNIPFVLDFHHHNIIFDSSQIREGTKDIIDLFPRILATWKRKNITPKMHYSEQTPPAITGMQRRKHSPRVATLPPCPPWMDLMIEAKDKEQAVFELMRTFKLPGFERISDIVPHVRKDDNKPAPTPKKKAPKKKKFKTEDGKEAADEADEVETAPVVIPDDEVGMGGPEGRVYWPPGMEEWLRPKKRVIKKKEDADASSTTPKKNKGAKAAADAAADAARAAAKLEAEKNGAVKTEPITADTSSKAAAKAKGGPRKVRAVQASAKAASATRKKTAVPVRSGAKKGKSKAELRADEGDEEEELSEEASEDMDELDDDDAEEVAPPGSAARGRTAKASRARPGRRASAKQVSYADGGNSDGD